MDSSQGLTPTLIKAYQEQLKHPNDKQDNLIYALVALYWSTATTALVLRLISRRITKTKLWWDDYMAIGAWICFTGLQGEGAACATLTRHVVFLNKAKLEIAMRFIFTSQFIYSVTIALYKAAILHYYQRIFTTKNPKIAIRVLLVFVWTLEFVYLMVFSFECRPLAHAWSLLTPGRCINVGAFLLSVSIIGIVLDIFILALPIPLIWQLQLSRSKKWSISGIFFLGGFVLVASTMRAVYIRHLVVGGDDPDPVWHSTPGLLWSAAELSVGISCACLPSIWPLIIKLRASARLTSRFHFSGKSTKQSQTVPLSDLGVSHSQSQAPEALPVNRPLGHHNDIEAAVPDNPIRSPNERHFV